jgi:hypothetical protein
MKGARVRIQVYLDPGDYLNLKKLADEKKIPISILGRIIISDYLSRLKTQPNIMEASEG